MPRVDQEPGVGGEPLPPGSTLLTLPVVKPDVVVPVVELFLKEGS